jgi:hypothetical protein
VLYPAVFVGKKSNSWNVFNTYPRVHNYLWIHI